MTEAQRSDRFFRSHLPSLALVSLALASAPANARVADASVERTAQGQLVLHWQDAAPVDLSKSDAPDATKGKMVARAIANGVYELPAPAHARPYFFLKKTRDHTVVTVAERVLPLDQGSNFRDLGGYPAADGKTVRWGLLFRSGATPLLSEPDRAEIAGLGLQQMIDLRSSEERQLAPSRRQAGAPSHPAADRRRHPAPQVRACRYRPPLGFDGSLSRKAARRRPGRTGATA